MANNYGYQYDTNPRKLDINYSKPKKKKNSSQKKKNTTYKSKANPKITKKVP